jgi:hypothetical protein
MEMPNTDSFLRQNDFLDLDHLVDSFLATFYVNPTTKILVDRLANEFTCINGKL